MIEKVNWTYKGRTITCVDDMPINSMGFVYEITTENGKKYIGQKTLFNRRKRKFGKRESAKVTDKRKKLYEIIHKEGDWKTYTGSNKELNKDIENGKKYTKKILFYAFHKKQLGYLETRELFTRNVLEDDSNYYNSNISGKFYHKDTKPL